MKYYRDLQPSETLQVGDMWRLANDSDAEWQTITVDDIAEAPEGGRIVTSVEASGIEYRRPVDAVPCEEHERLRQRLAEAESLLGEASRGGQQINAEVAVLRKMVLRLNEDDTLKDGLLCSAHSQIMEDRQRHNAAIDKADRLAAEQEQVIGQLRAKADNDKSAYRQAVVALRQELAALQSQPRLQPVTPEAMAELEGRDALVILFRHKESSHWRNRYCVVRWDARANCWWGGPGGLENPLEWHWYIEPSTIPEVQQ